MYENGREACMRISVMGVGASREKEKGLLKNGQTRLEFKDCR